MNIIKIEDAGMKKQKQLIYDLMAGYYDLDRVQFPECKIVEDEFVEGKPCEELYRQVYEARVRLCERLGVDEDKDIQTIINCMDDISRILAMKMFDYGANKDVFEQNRKFRGEK